MARKHWLRFGLPVLLLLLAVGVALALVFTRPSPEEGGAGRQGTLVDAARVARCEYPLEIDVQGEVQPQDAVQVTPQVSGLVTEVSPQLEPGGVLRKGEVLFTIEQTDYRLALEQARSRVQEAELTLKRELARQEVAQRTLRDLAGSPRETSRPDLVTHEAQVRAARAALEAARAERRQAQVNLERTQPTAPFDAVVRSANVDAGARVSPAAAVAELVSVEAFRVHTAVPAPLLPSIPLQGEDPAHALVRYPSGNEERRIPGTVVRRLPDVGQAGRMARVLVRIDDPLGLHADRQNPLPATAVPLLLNSYVQVTIDAGKSVQAVRIPRSWLRRGDRVYVVDANRQLAIRQVTVAWEQADYVLVTEGLLQGERVVTTRLAAPISGLPLRLGDVAEQNCAEAEPLSDE